MRHTIFVLLLAICGSVVAQSPIDIAATGDALYSEGNYAQAIEKYESVIAQGMASAELYYNLGNAYYRENNLSHAIINYKRALRLSPSMHDAQQNLTLAEARTTDRINTIPKIFIVRWFDNICSSTSLTVWCFLWLLCIALIVAAVVIMVVSKNISIKKWMLAVCVVVGIFFILILWVGLVSIHRNNTHNEAVIVEQAIAIKSSPEQRTTDKMILHEGTIVKITDSVQGLYKVSIADGTSGYCEKTAVEII